MEIIKIMEQGALSLINTMETLQRAFNAFYGKTKKQKRPGKFPAPPIV